MARFLRHPKLARTTSYHTKGTICCSKTGTLLFDQHGAGMCVSVACMYIMHVCLHMWFGTCISTPIIPHTCTLPWYTTVDKCYTELMPLPPLPICICSVPIKYRNPENRVEHMCTRACSNILVRVTCITDVCSVSYELLEGSRSVCHCQHSKSIIEQSAFIEKQTPSEVLQKHSL